ncbi:alanyl-tRNA synthetase [Leuconostoc citreum]|uniref:alanyl-tRNA synthetase n=1 Tax=Leuconostoc citreum TaxID=33964 RepID=UPI0029589DCB|nr:alanyl-tRNA synthetase [Leuconostoc citreum]MDV8932111.1 alanyl-tRNA synthetase [Leuconostoc citreum]
MDLTKSDVREITMSKYFNKKTVPYWVIAVLVVVIIVLGIYVYNLSNRSTTTIVTAPTKSASSEKASSSTQKYVAGKDYKITYSNTNLIDKATIQKGLKASYLTDINDLMNTDQQTGSNMAKIEVYYNKDKNLLVENLFKNGHSSNEATTAVVYDLKNNQIVNSGVNYDTNYQPSWLVYTWEKLSK